MAQEYRQGKWLTTTEKDLRVYMEKILWRVPEKQRHAS